MLNQYSFKDLHAFVASLGVYGRFMLESFGYPLNFATIAAGSSGNAVLQLSANADFLLTGIYIAGSAGASLTGNLIQIVDNGASDNFFQAPVPLNSALSSVQAGYYNTLQFPRIVGNSSSLTATITNGSLAALTTPQLYFEGALIKVMGAS